MKEKTNSKETYRITKRKTNTSFTIAFKLQKRYEWYIQLFRFFFFRKNKNWFVCEHLKRTNALAKCTRFSIFAFVSHEWTTYSVRTTKCEDIQHAYTHSHTPRLARFLIIFVVMNMTFLLLLLVLLQHV